jgi:hypothetical protein
VILVSTAAHAAGQDCWTFQGAAKMSMYLHGRTQEQAVAYFSMSVSGCKWLVRLRRDHGTNAANAPDYLEGAFDQSAVYYLCNIKTAVERQRGQGSKLNAPNIAYGQAYNGEVFYHRMAPEITPIWLAYGSACYWNNRVTNLVEPGMLFDGTGVYYGPPRHPRLRAEWTLSNSEPRVPIKVVYFSEGFVQAPTGGVVRLPPPYDRGFTNAVYQVDSFANLDNGLRMPASSSLKVFEIKQDGKTSGDLRLFVEYHMRLTNAARMTGQMAFQPAIPGVTLLQDARHGLLNYYATNRWPTKIELKEGTYFAALRTAAIQHTASRGVLKSVRLALLVLFALPFTVLIWKLFARKKQTD